MAGTAHATAASAIASRMTSGADSIEIAGKDHAHACHQQQHAGVHRDAQLQVQGEHLPAVPGQRTRRRGVVDHAIGMQGPQLRFKRVH